MKTRHDSDDQIELATAMLVLFAVTTVLGAAFLIVVDMCKRCGL